MESRAINPILKLQKLTKQYEEFGKTPPIILDTDGGLDPDDFSILCSGLLDDKNIDVRAIVTVGEFVDIKAKIFKAILAQIGRKDIPVFTGNGIHYSTVCETHQLDSKSHSIFQLTQNLDKSIQAKYQEQLSKTYPIEIFGEEFYPFQGSAWKSLHFSHYVPDGNFEDAVIFAKKLISEHKEYIVVSTGELTNIAKYYEKKLSKNIILMHMGGWSADNKLDKSAIFPRQFMGRNTITDLTASEIVFNDPESNVILCMSHLRKQYNLELSSDICRLLTLADEIPVKDLSKKRAQKLLTFLSKKEVNDDMSHDKMISELIKLLPTFGVSTLSEADNIGKALARDFANWRAYTSLPYIIMSDPITMLLSIKPDLITSSELVTIKINSEAAFKNKEKFMCSAFISTIKTEVGGRIAAITKIKDSRNAMESIITGMLKHAYPGVTYQKFIEISENKEISLTRKSEELNKIVLASKIKVESQFYPRQRFYFKLHINLKITRSEIKYSIRRDTVENKTHALFPHSSMKCENETYSDKNLKKIISVIEHSAIDFSENGLKKFIFEYTIENNNTQYIYSNLSQEEVENNLKNVLNEIEQHVKRYIKVCSPCLIL
jgi:inosine-uridine nucleoside N-ribohydrolase